MQLMNIQALSAGERAADGTTLVLAKDGAQLNLLAFTKDFSEMSPLLTFSGKAGHILWVDDNSVLLSVDSNLILLKGNECKTVLKAHKTENFFWHACKLRDKILVQEYGLPPTSLFASSDLQRWNEVVSNTSIDRYSLHFHDVVYDATDDQLITTLGDGNYTRVACCRGDNYSTWRPLFKGAWQFLPIVPLEKKIVFGMDSGITCGGVGIYDRAESYWSFNFFKWAETGSIRLVQMCDLKRLGNNLWVAAFGDPQAIALSTDLKKWKMLHVDGFDKTFNFNMKITVSASNVVCCTGKHLLIFKNEELSKMTAALQHSLIDCPAYFDRLKGVFFKLDKQLRYKFR